MDHLACAKQLCYNYCSYNKLFYHHIVELQVRIWLVALREKSCNLKTDLPTKTGSFSPLTPPTQSIQCRLYCMTTFRAKPMNKVNFLDLGTTALCEKNLPGNEARPQRIRPKLCMNCVCDIVFHPYYTSVTTEGSLGKFLDVQFSFLTLEFQFRTPGFCDRIIGGSWDWTHDMEFTRLPC